MHSMVFLHGWGAILQHLAAAQHAGMYVCIWRVRGQGDGCGGMQLARRRAVAVRVRMPPRWHGPGGKMPVKRQAHRCGLCCPLRSCVLPCTHCMMSMLGVWRTAWCRVCMPWGKHQSDCRQAPWQLAWVMAIRSKDHMVSGHRSYVVGRHAAKVIPLQVT